MLIKNIKNKDPNADARPAIMRGFNRLKLYTKGEPSYLTTIKFNRKLLTYGHVLASF